MTSIKQNVFKEKYDEAKELIKKFDNIIKDSDCVLFNIKEVKEGVEEDTVSKLYDEIGESKNTLDFLKNKTDIKYTKNLDKYFKEIDKRKGILDGIKNRNESLFGVKNKIVLSKDNYKF